MRAAPVAVARAALSTTSLKQSPFNPTMGWRGFFYALTRPIPAEDHTGRYSESMAPDCSICCSRCPGFVSSVQTTSHNSHYPETASHGDLAVAPSSHRMRRGHYICYFVLVSLKPVFLSNLPYRYFPSALIVSVSFSPSSSRIIWLSFTR